MLRIEIDTTEAARSPHASEQLDATIDFLRNLRAIVRGEPWGVAADMERLQQMTGGFPAAPIAPAPVPLAPVAGVPVPPAANFPPPAANPVPPGPTATAGEVADLDSTGRRWDDRIDSSNKKKIADGTWQKRRGVDDVTYARIKAEVLGATHTPGAVPPAPVAAVPPAPLHAVDPGVTAFGGAPIPPPPAAASVPPVPVPPPAPAAAAEKPPTQLLFERITAQQQSGQIRPDHVKALCQELGLADMSGIFSRPDLIPSLNALLDRDAGPYVPPA